MSLPTLLAAVASGAKTGRRGTVTLTGATIEDPTNGQAEIRINTDGTTDKLDPGASQINNSTDWIIPNSAANSTYEVKWTLVSGDTPSGGTMVGAADTWFPLTSNQSIGYGPVSGSESGVIRIYIRYGSGPTLDTGDYDITANVVP